MSQHQRPPEAFRSRGLFDNGMGYVCVSRFKSGGRVETGVFLVDAYCLGVKDALFEQFVSEDEYQEFLDELFAEKPEPMTPPAARKLVEQAAAYAASLGIAPAADYKKGCRVFGGIHAQDWHEDFTFGKDGKPFFMPGPSDSPSRCQKILALLNAHCGPGNYGFLIPEAPLDSELVEYDDEVPSAELEDMGTRFGESHPNAEVILNPPGIPKISDILGKLVEPWTDPGMTLRDVEVVYEVGKTAWNYSLLTSAAQKSVRRELEAMLGEDGTKVFDELVDRRNKLFPDDPRFITSVEISERKPHVFDIRAAYALNPDDIPDDIHEEK